MDKLADVFPDRPAPVPAKIEIQMTPQQARKLVESHSRLAQVYQDMGLAEVSMNHRREATEIGKRLKAFLGRK